MEDEEKLRQGYAAAVVRGADDTGFTGEEEPPYDTLALLMWAEVEEPQLWRSAHGLDKDGENARVVRAVSDAAAGVLCLADGALAADGRDVGYLMAAWIDRALAQADAQLHARAAADDDGRPLALKPVRATMRALAIGRWAATPPGRATRTKAADPMVIPEQAAEGLGHLLVIYAIAMTAGGS
jgi:hypothetical protein